jgi:hypothetical protein
MEKETIGQRVIRLREHFGIKKQGKLSEEIRMSQANVSRVEGDVQIPSKAFLHALKERFAANPHWIMTGEGEMFISPEEFISNGIELLGAKKIGEGFLKLVNDPKYKELQSVIAVGEMTKGSIDPKLEAYLQYILDKWNQGDETVRGWLMIQLRIAFQEVGKKLEEEKKE